MTDPRPLDPVDVAKTRVDGPLRRTRRALGFERVVRVLWPIWPAWGLAFASVVFGVLDVLDPRIVQGLGGALLVFTALVCLRALFKYRRPRRVEARDRIDATLPGRPLATLEDNLAVGVSDPATTAVWTAHRNRVAARALSARAVPADLRLSGQDPVALRYVATVAVVMALLFGVIWRVGDIADTLPGAPGPAMASGPAWEGWVEPPRYTGLPTRYLNDISAPEFEVPTGSRLTLRLYGGGDDLAVRHGLDPSLPAEPDLDPAQDIAVLQSGPLDIDGPGGRSWAVIATPDARPTVQITGPPERMATGEMRLPYAAQDDYAVIGGTAEIRLNLAAIDRRYGLAPEPESRPTLVVDLPLTLSGDRSDYEAVLAENLSKHSWANLPVTVTLIVQDDRGQTGATQPEAMDLPGRRFFDPLANAIIEQRRDLLWSRENAPRIAQVLRAVTHLPEDVIKDDGAYLVLTSAMDQLDTAIASDAPMDDDLRDEIAEALWQAALQFEEGDLADAAERLRRAQDRLSEAMRQGASPDEIEQLMRELREAMNDFMRQMAEQALRDPNQQMSEAPPEGQEVTQDQLQQMMDRIQELMEQGRMAEAQQLLDQMMQMMQNMQMQFTQGQQGMQGQQSPGQQALEGLQDTLRQQQGLADESFSQLQQGQPGQPQQGQPGQPQPGQQQGGPQPGQQQGTQPGQQGPGEQPGQQQGTGPGQGQPQPGQPGTQPGGLADELARRQQALRDTLRNQQNALPGTGTPEGDAARDALDRAGRAMDEAADALNQGDLADALDNQSEAMDALREGIQNLGDALAQAQQQIPGTQEGRLDGVDPGTNPRDPLGRETGAQGRFGTDDGLLQDEDVYRRAEELLDEIRRRAGETDRSEAERDYLKRLLDRF